jgi:hypothetical protein
MGIALQTYPIEIESFATDILNRSECTGVQALSFAAAYYANVVAFNLPPVNRAPLRLDITESPQRHGSYHWAKDEREVIIRADSNAWLSQCLRAEAAHAAHFDVISRHANPLTLATHTLHALSEVLDDYHPVHACTEMSNNVDPYLFDFDLLEDDDGHASSAFLRQRLSVNTVLRKKQIHWVARVLPRRGGRNERVFDKIIYEKHLEHVLAEPSDVAFIPERFYAGEEIPKPFATVRKVFLEANPYVIPKEECVEWRGRRITHFASQIDFVALVLASENSAQLTERTLRQRVQAAQG